MSKAKSTRPVGTAIYSFLKGELYKAAPSFIAVMKTDRCITKHNHAEWAVDLAQRWMAGTGQTFINPSLYSP